MAKKKQSGLDQTALVLALIGALNWGLIGVGNSSWNVVNMIFGSVAWLERLVYILVGVSALWVGYKKFGQ